jgi:protease-4
MEIQRIGKPVVASVSDMAASGAYWVASQCDLIVATPSSYVGSIGVILQVPNYEELMDTIGIEYTTLTAGEYKDTGSPFRSLTSTEVAMLQEDIDFAYRQFIDGVAAGRDLPVSEVESMATGWVWAGEKALEMGLVDELGTFNDATDAAADLAGIDDYEVVYYDEVDPWSVLYWLLSAVEGLQPLSESDLSGTSGPPVPR